MINFDINTFELYKNYSISASAGTGKTYNMVNIVNKLVASGIDISNILIVTYTEKAAGELKDRIGKNFKENHINVDMNQAHIGTIHSFCKDTIDSYYITMGLPSKLSVIDDSKMDDLYERYIRDLIYDNRFCPKNDKEINDFKKIKDIAKKICLDKHNNLDNSISSFNVNDFDYFFIDLNERITKLSNEEAFEFYQTCNNIDGNFKIYYGQLYESINYAMKDKTYSENIKNIKEQGFFNVRQNSKIFKEDNFPFLSQLRKYQRNEIIDYIEYALEFYKLWEQEKMVHGWLTFDDMLKKVRQAVLENDNLVQKLIHQYKYALIDEFQDTNQLQWDIFKKVFLDSNDNNIIVVGDRKQSIYSFQGADLTVYDTAVKSILDRGGIECVLPKNFRSSKSLIDGYNALFKTDSFKSLNYSDVEVGKEDIFSTYEGSEMAGINIVSKENEGEYSTVTPNEFAKKCVALIIDYCSKDSEGHTKLRLDKEQRNVTFKDFMVLARTRTELSAISYELTRAGVPFVKYKDDGLFKGIECAQWIALINAILKPNYTGQNRNVFRQVLFTKFFGIALKDINSTEFELDDGEEMLLLLKWKDLANNYKYDELINSILSESRLETVLGTISEIQSLNIFKQIGDYALNYLLAGNSLLSLKNKLVKLTNNAKDEDDSMDGTIVAKGTDFDCVELMTMHASKGLDRPIVIVVGGEKRNKEANSINIIHKDFTCIDGSVTKKPYLTITKDKDIYKDEEQEERDRLFYVAYTRARNIMILPYYKENKDVKVISSIKDYLNDSTNKQLFQKVIYDENTIPSYQYLKDQVQTILNRNVEQDSIDEQLILLNKLSKSMNKHCSFKHSYASMSSKQTDHLVVNDNINKNKEGEEIDSKISFVDETPIRANVKYSEIEQLTIPDGFPKGASIGTTLHEVFEQFEFTTINDNNNLYKIIEERFKFNKLHLEVAFSDYVKEIVFNVLNAKLPVIHGANIDTINYFKLNSLPKENRKAEVEFNFSDKNDLKNTNYCNGFIDLLFKRGDYYSILDWKSDTINNDDLLSYNKIEHLSTRVDGHYSIQRVLYSYTLINWLYDLGIENSKEEVFNKHFGGIYYVFIRGCYEDTFNGIYAQTWSSYNDLENEYKKIMEKCIYMKAGDNNE